MLKKLIYNKNSKVEELESSRRKDLGNYKTSVRTISVPAERRTGNPQNTNEKHYCLSQFAQRFFGNRKSEKCCETSALASITYTTCKVSGHCFVKKL
jgi:hypothetical protein